MIHNIYCTPILFLMCQAVYQLILYRINNPILQRRNERFSEIKQLKTGRAGTQIQVCLKQKIIQKAQLLRSPAVGQRSCPVYKVLHVGNEIVGDAMTSNVQTSHFHSFFRVKALQKSFFFQPADHKNIFQLNDFCVVLMNRGIFALHTLCTNLLSWNQIVFFQMFKQVMTKCRKSYFAN